MLRLAPLYDVLSTLVYGDNRLAMHIDTVHRTNQVTADRIINEAARWGMSRRRAAQIIADMLARAPAAAEAARKESDELLDEVPGVIDSQLAQLLSSFAADGSVATSITP